MRREVRARGQEEASLALDAHVESADGSLEALSLGAHLFRAVQSYASTDRSIYVIWLRTALSGLGAHQRRGELAVDVEELARPRLPRPLSVHHRDANRNAVLNQ